MVYSDWRIQDILYLCSDKVGNTWALFRTNEIAMIDLKTQTILTSEQLRSERRDNLIYASPPEDVMIKINKYKREHQIQY